MKIFRALGFGILLWILHLYFETSFIAFESALTASFTVVDVAATQAAAVLEQTIVIE